MKSALTIIIPTFNRLNYLKKLLKFLALEEKIYNENINLIVLNNCSTDGTKDYLHEFSSKKPHWKFINNESNIGTDRNMVKGIKYVKTKYCWIIGDDDLPLTGTISSINKLVKKESIGLVYITPYWDKNIYKINTKKQVYSFSYLTNYELAEKAHIFTTFISSWIFNIDFLKKKDSSLKIIDNFVGSYFSQLSWILQILSKKQLKFLVSNGDYIMATTDNVHPYRVLNTFLFSFPEIVNKLLDDAKLIDIILRNYCLRYLPRLIFSVNTGVFFHSTDKEKKVKISKYLSKYPEFKYFCKPAFLISKFTPTFIAKFISKIFRLIKKLNFNSN